MIRISDKHNCCGCSACVQICPKQSITCEYDRQGFFYPIVNEATCINCGLCKKVCPVLNHSTSKLPLEVYAALNINPDIRRNSSSGGIFTNLGEWVITQGGVVFGASYDDKWLVEHTYVESVEGLIKLMGSKYLQSRIGNSYIHVRQFLESGRIVLFTGTPCQVAGLKRFLRKEYDNLITVDIVCHGTPSPLVWQKYLEHILGEKYSNIIKNITFRDKSTGWKKYSFVVHGNDTIERITSKSATGTILFSETLDKNLFMQSFLKNLSIRPSCTQCPAKSGRSGSDITLGDFWGIGNVHPEWDDDKGTSLVLINSNKGKSLLFSCAESLSLLATNYHVALKGNPSIKYSSRASKYSSKFWECFYSSGFAEVPVIIRKCRPSILKKCKSLFIYYYRAVCKRIISK